MLSVILLALYISLGLISTVRSYLPGANKWEEENDSNYLNDFRTTPAGHAYIHRDDTDAGIILKVKLN